MNLLRIGVRLESQRVAVEPVSVTFVARPRWILARAEMCDNGLASLGFGMVVRSSEILSSLLQGLHVRNWSSGW